MVIIAAGHGTDDDADWWVVGLQSSTKREFNLISWINLMDSN